MLTSSHPRQTKNRTALIATDRRRRRMSGGEVALLAAALLFFLPVASWAQSLVLSKSSVQVVETAGETTYEVSLSTTPTGGHVLVRLRSKDPKIAKVDLAWLVFTPGASSDCAGTDNKRWHCPQMVTVTGVSDEVDNYADERHVEIEHKATGGGFNNKTGVVRVSVTDDDTASIMVTAPSDSVSVKETGTDSAVYKVKLSSEPTDTVTVAVTSADQSIATASPSRLTFATTNYGSEQNVYVTGVREEAVRDRTTTIKFTGKGGGYTGVRPVGEPEEGYVVTVTNVSPTAALLFHPVEEVTGDVTKLVTVTGRGERHLHGEIGCSTYRQGDRQYPQRRKYARREHLPVEIRYIPRDTNIHFQQL